MDLRKAIKYLEMNHPMDGQTERQAKLKVIKLYENQEMTTARTATLLDVSLFDLDDEIERIKNN